MRPGTGRPRAPTISSTLDRTLSRVYNTLGELYQQIGAAGTSGVTTTFGYDSTIWSA